MTCRRDDATLQVTQDKSHCVNRVMALWQVALDLQHFNSSECDRRVYIYMQFIHPFIIPFNYYRHCNQLLQLFFLSGFIEELQGNNQTPNAIKSFTLYRLKESCAIGAAVLGAKVINHKIDINYNQTIEVLFTL